MATHEDLSRSHEAKSGSDRSFGIVFTVVFALIGVWPLVSGGGVRWWSLALAAAVLALALAAPELLALPNRLWTRLGLLLNRIVSPIALAVVYFAVVTPMGMAMRLRGKDPMRLRRLPEGASYWIKREPPGPRPDSLPNQF